MKRQTAIALLLATSAAASGCSGLNVSGVLTMTYNTPAITQAVMTPGAERELSAAPSPRKPAAHAQQ